MSRMRSRGRLLFAVAAFGHTKVSFALESTGSPSRKLRFWNHTVQANFPNEDAMRAQMSEKGEGSLFAVWDGHGGRSGSQFAQSRMLDVACKKLLVGKTEFHVRDALHEAFRVTETEFENICWEQCIGSNRWSAATVGTCALVVHVADDLSMITVANAGDCRVVLGTRDMQAITLSTDHNSKLEPEQLRARAEHPGEDDILHQASPESWYIKGRLQPTRSIGDFYLKQARFNSPNIGPARIRTQYTPPYVHWEPQITTHRVQRRDNILILATDGLWDDLTVPQAIEIATKAVERNEDPAQALVQAARGHAAHRLGVTIQQLDNHTRKLLQGGRGSLRSIHDDITVVVVKFLDELEAQESHGNSFYDTLLRNLRLR